MIVYQNYPAIHQITYLFHIISYIRSHTYFIYIINPSCKLWHHSNLNKFEKMSSKSIPSIPKHIQMQLLHWYTDREHQNGINDRQCRPPSYMAYHTRVFPLECSTQRSVLGNMIWYNFRLPTAWHCILREVHRCGKDKCRVPTFDYNLMPNIL